jgi:polyribonucleotide nucleotidyltransferase
MPKLYPYKATIQNNSIDTNLMDFLRIHNQKIETALFSSSDKKERSENLKIVLENIKQQIQNYKYKSQIKIQIIIFLDNQAYKYLEDNKDFLDYLIYIIKYDNRFKISFTQDTENNNKLQDFITEKTQKEISLFNKFELNEFIKNTNIALKNDDKLLLINISESEQYENTYSTGVDILNFTSFYSKISELTRFDSNLEIDSILNKIFLSFNDVNQIYSELYKAYYELLTEIVRNNLIQKEKRVDGRKLKQIRKLQAEIDILPETHGSSLFSRGETQVLNILTIGTSDDAQLLDDMETIEKDYKYYIHHYNFPPYSVGETGRYIGPGRREIGHGALAEKALLPVLPDIDIFPYTIRTVSECLGSNGSTSMASTCSSSLSLMAGGVPIKSHVAGISMGLAYDEKSQQFKILTDIQGEEDHHADMDFKITGTNDGITAIQLDNKLGGVPFEVLDKAITQSREALHEILDLMTQTISTPRKDISNKAPRVEIVFVPIDKIRDVIGSGGSIINGLQAEYKVEINLDNDSGKCAVYGKNFDSVISCINKIKNIIKVYQKGDEIKGTVFRMETYGAFIKIEGTEKEALIHISQLGFGKRIEKVTDAINLGDKVECTIDAINDKGQLNLQLNKIN